MGQRRQEERTFRFGKNIKSQKQLEIKLSIQLTSVFNDEQRAVRRKEYFVLVTMKLETIGTSV